MRKFKKLAVLAITIPTLLSSTNISFAMIPPFQSIVYDSQQQIYEIINIPLNQLFLDGQGNVLFNQNVQYNDKCGFIAVQSDLTATNIQDTYIVNSIFHDENGYIYNENGYFTYNNGQPVQLPLPQQQFEAIPSEQCHYNTVDNSPFEQEEIQEQNEQVENNKSPKPPKSTQKTAKTRKHCKIDCILCNEKECARPNGKPHIHKKDDTKTQQYICTKCGRTFTLDENIKVVKKSRQKT